MLSRIFYLKLTVYVLTPVMVFFAFLYVLFGYLSTKQSKIQVYDNRNVCCGGMGCTSLVGRLHFCIKPCLYFLWMRSKFDVNLHHKYVFAANVSQKLSTAQPLRIICICRKYELGLKQHFVFQPTDSFQSLLLLPESVQNIVNLKLF